MVNTSFQVVGLGYTIIIQYKRWTDHYQETSMRSSDSPKFCPHMRAEKRAFAYTRLPLRCVSSHNKPHFCLSHLSERLRGSSICKVIAEIAELSTMRASSFLPSSSSSPSFSTGLTLYSWNKLARTATNSTCENFRPTHSRGPSAQGTKAPASGSMNVSLSIGDV